MTQTLVRTTSTRWLPLRILAVTVAAILILAGCSSSSSDSSGEDSRGPSKKVSETKSGGKVFGDAGDIVDIDVLLSAVEGLADQDALAVDITFDADPSVLAGMVDGVNDAAAAAIVDALNDGVIRIAGMEKRMALQVDLGSSVVDVRFLNDILYVRAPVKDLMDLFGAQASTAAELEEMVSQLEMMIPEVRDLVNGEWVAVDVPAVLAELGFDEGDFTEELMETVNPAALEKFAAALPAAFESAEVTVDSTNGNTTRLKVDVASAEFVSSLFDALDSSGALSDLPVGDSLNLDELREDAEELPDVTFYVEVTDGTLSAAEFDVAQLDEETSGKFVIRAEISDSTELLETPSAKEIDPARVASLIGGFASGPPGLLVGRGLKRKCMRTGLSRTCTDSRSRR